MRLLLEDFEVEGIVARATLDSVKGQLLLRLDSLFGRETYDLGPDDFADETTSDVTDLLIKAEQLSWEDVQYAAEKLIRSNMWNEYGEMR